MLAAFVLLLAGCGDGEQQQQPAAGAAIPGGGLSIDEARTSALDGPLMVVGFLARRDGELRLCDGLRESYPPQCVEPSLRVEGEVDGEVGARVSLLGDVEGDVIRVSKTAQG